MKPSKKMRTPRFTIEKECSEQKPVELVTLLEEPKNTSDRLFNTPETQIIHFCVVKLKGDNTCTMFEI